jgi:hypothetical protein
MKIAQPNINEITPESSVLIIFRGARKNKSRLDVATILRAPRIISKSQKFCRHKEAAKEAAEKKNAISTIEKIA